MLEQLKLETKRIMDRVNEMSLRERGIIFVTLLVVLYFFAHQLLFAPLLGEQKLLQSQLQAKRVQIQAIESQIQAVATDGQSGSGSKQARAEALEVELQSLGKNLAAATSGLVSPKEMARVIEQMLIKNRNLRLVRAENIPPEPLVGDAPPAQSTPPAARGTNLVIYKHGTRVELEGNYMEIVKYLRALEGLPWKVFWGQVNLKSEKYPVSRLTLVVYTLSTHEGWIAI
jgi:MSHA biogenesis protein MshJ